MICGSIARSFGSNSRVGQLSMIAGAIAEPSMSDKRLRGEDDGSVLLAQRLQPFAQLAGKALVVKREPTFIDDQQRRPAVEAVLRCDERDRRVRRVRPPVPISPSVSKTWTEASPSRSSLGVEQTAIRTAEAIGLQRALERIAIAAARTGR